MNIRDMSIRVKLNLLIGGLGAVGVIMIGFTYFSLHALDDISRRSAILRDIGAKGKIAQGVQLYVANIWQYFTDASLTKNADSINVDAKGNYDKAIVALDRIASQSSDHKEIVEQSDEVKKKLADMWSAGALMYKAYMIGQAEGDTAMTGFDNASGALIKEAGDLSDHFDTISNNAMSELGDNEKSAKSVMLIFISVGSLISFFIVTMMFFIKNLILRPLKEVIDATDSIARMNLGVEIRPWSNDESGKMLASLRNMVANLRQTVTLIRDAGLSVEENSDNLASHVHGISEHIHEQSQRANQVAVSSEEMSSTIGNIAENLSSIVELARTTYDLAITGGQTMDRTIGESQEISNAVSESSQIVVTLGERSNQIGDIVNVIKDIADQTNLLALNAAIEAARAGDQGRGFAVVADEVRKLAERTGKATAEIGETITLIQNETERAVASTNASLDRVGSGVSLSTQTGGHLHAIVERITELQSRVNEVASATEEMSATAGSISQDIAVVATSANDTNTEISDIQSSSQKLARLSDNLKTEVGKFKL